MSAVLTAAAPVAADERADEAAWLKATDTLGRGDPAAARRELEALADGSPGGRWSDDALAEAAAIAERQGDLAGARALWRRVIAEYPRSSQARRAGPRLAALEAAGGDDGRWDPVAAAHARIERATAAAEDPTPLLRELAALLEANPGYPRWFVAALWLAESWARIGDRGAALAWVDRALAAAADSPERFRAGLAKADLLAEMGELDAAEAAYQRLVPPDALARGAIVDARAELARTRWRWQLQIGARFAIGLCAVVAIAVLRRAAASWRGAVRALWPPPLEVIYLLPVALGFAVIAETGNTMAARATQIIVGSGCAIAWIGGAVYAAARRRGAMTRRFLFGYVLWIVVATGSVCYAAVAHDQLLNLLIETWRRGHE